MESTWSVPVQAAPVEIFKPSRCNGVVASAGTLTVRVFQAPAVRLPYQLDVQPQLWSCR